MAYSIRSMFPVLFFVMTCREVFAGLDFSIEGKSTGGIPALSVQNAKLYKGGIGDQLLVFVPDPADACATIHNIPPTDGIFGTPFFDTRDDDHHRSCVTFS